MISYVHHHRIAAFKMVLHSFLIVFVFLLEIALILITSVVRNTLFSSKSCSVINPGCVSVK